MQGRDGGRIDRGVGLLQAALGRHLLGAVQIAFVDLLGGVRPLLQAEQADLGAVVGGQAALGRTPAAEQGMLALGRGGGFGAQVGDHAVDLLLDLGLHVGQFVLGALHVRIVGLEIGLQLGQAGRQVGLALAQFLDGGRAEGRAHVLAAAAAADLLQGRLQARLVLGRVGLGLGDLLVEGRDFLLSHGGAFDAHQVVRGLVLLDLGLGGLGVGAQAVDIGAEVAIGLVDGRRLGVHLALHIEVHEAVHDRRRLGGRLGRRRDLDHIGQAGAAHLGAPEDRVGHLADRGRRRVRQVARLALEVGVELGIVIELQVAHDRLGQGRRAKHLDLGVDRAGVGRQPRLGGFGLGQVLVVRVDQHRAGGGVLGRDLHHRRDHHRENGDGDAQREPGAAQQGAEHLPQVHPLGLVDPHPSRTHRRGDIMRNRHETVHRLQPSNRARRTRASTRQAKAHCRASDQV